VATGYAIAYADMQPESTSHVDRIIAVTCAVCICLTEIDNRLWSQENNNENGFNISKILL